VVNIFFTEIVSSKFTEIQRRGHRAKKLTKEEMTEVMKNKVTSYRSNRLRNKCLKA
jgi:hypothetical protein